MTARPGSILCLFWTCFCGLNPGVTVTTNPNTVTEPSCSRRCSSRSHVLPSPCRIHHFKFTIPRFFDTQFLVCNAKFMIFDSLHRRPPLHKTCDLTAAPTRIPEALPWYPCHNLSEPPHKITLWRVNAWGCLCTYGPVRSCRGVFCRTR